MQWLTKKFLSEKCFTFCPNRRKLVLSTSAFVAIHSSATCGAETTSLAYVCVCSRHWYDLDREWPLRQQSESVDCHKWPQKYTPHRVGHDATRKPCCLASMKNCWCSPIFSSGSHRTARTLAVRATKKLITMSWYRLCFFRERSI